ncbi:deoxynucleoside kinase [Patescibacteria group bacterium]|nr:deoxynucleoside kinase [Patescibacteria group bacterium]
MRPVIWVESIIGAGKTTYAREMSKRLGLYLGSEPVDGNPFLEKFYKDPKRWAFDMQIFLLKERFKQQLHAATIAIGAGDWNGAILDRSISGDRVFAKMHMQAGNIDPDSWAAYEDFHMLMCTQLLPPTRIIRLQCEPETAYERVRMRNRGAEETLSLDYLKALDAAYQDLWDELDRGLLPWGHRVKVETVHWDPIADMPNWDRHAQSLARSCGIPYAGAEESEA